MEEPKDKRTTKYKQWKALQSEVITETVGLGDVLRCLTDNQRGQYINFIDTRKKGKWERNEMQLMFDLYAHAFAIQYQIKSFGCNCQGCAKILQEIQDKLDKVYYEN